ncbi:uncharacterized protein LOC126323278 [Schistocerca gregaria]|uniref:uncharacterized protein LOC126323278 n=1 Tax=Schistocerca gregaria TaxID=7010 RepID=UPI00211EE5A2|nr:uncharacterized protein LOC126323278 [Schistocerca gregaria]
MWCKPFVLLGSEDGRLEGRSTESLLGRFQAGEVDESYLVKQAITHISQSKRSERSVDEAPRSSLKESEDANMVTHVVKRTNVHLSEPPAEFVKSRKINILDLVGEEAPMSPRSPEKRERYPEIFDTQTTWSYAREDGFFTDYYVLGEVLPEELTRNCPAFTITYESFRQGILNETTLNNEYDGRESSSSTDTSEDSYLDYGEEDSSLSEHDGLYRNSFGYKSEKMSSFKYDPESASETTSSFEQDPESMSESDYPYFRLQ